MTISEEDKKTHAEFIQNLTDEQMQLMVERTSEMLLDWSRKEEVESEEHKFLADLAVPVGVYVLYHIDELAAGNGGEILSTLVMSTAFAAFNYGREVEREKTNE